MSTNAAATPSLTRSPKMPTCPNCGRTLTAGEVPHGVCTRCEVEIAATFADVRLPHDFEDDLLLCAADAHGLPF